MHPKFTSDKKRYAAAGKKKTLNVGRGGGSAGLDDYKYEDVNDDEDDFMWNWLSEFDLYEWYTLRSDSEKQSAVLH